MLIQSRSTNNVVDLAQYVDRLNALPNREEGAFCKAILEHLPDGILVLTKTGEQVYTNRIAQKVCAQVSAPMTHADGALKKIWQVCQTLIQNHLLSQSLEVLMSEIQIGPSGVLEVWVQWLKLTGEQAYLLVTLKDRLQSTQNIAALEAKQYRLTARETEVWLLRRTGHDYQEIAVRLYISLNTVKKHLKNSYAKRRAYLDMDE